MRPQHVLRAMPHRLPDDASNAVLVTSERTVAGLAEREAICGGRGGPASNRREAAGRGLESPPPFPLLPLSACRARTRD